jgi:hypothetical protein
MQKEMLKSKTFWTGVGMIIYGVITMHNNPEEAVQNILQGLAFIFLRQAISKTYNHKNNEEYFPYK